MERMSLRSQFTQGRQNCADKFLKILLWIPKNLSQGEKSEQHPLESDTCE